MLLTNSTACRSVRRIVKGAFASEVEMNKAEQARDRAYEEEGVGFQEGEMRRKSDSRWRIRQRLQPPISEYFEKEQYNHFVDTFVRGGDLGPAMDWEHFPHPARVFKDLSERGSFGEGIVFRDKQVGFVLSTIAKRIKRSIATGDVANAETDLQHALDLREYTKSSSHAFGPMSRTSLMQCFVSRQHYKASLQFFTNEIEPLDGEHPHTTSLRLVAYCRLGIFESAFLLFETSIASSKRFLAPCGHAFLSELCLNKNADVALISKLCLIIENNDATLPSEEPVLRDVLGRMLQSDYGEVFYEKYKHKLGGFDKLCSLPGFVKIVAASPAELVPKASKHGSVALLVSCTSAPDLASLIQVTPHINPRYAAVVVKKLLRWCLKCNSPAAFMAGLTCFKTAMEAFPPAMIDKETRQLAENMATRSREMMSKTPKITQ